MAVNRATNTTTSVSGLPKEIMPESKFSDLPVL